MTRRNKLSLKRKWEPEVSATALYHRASKLVNKAKDDWDKPLTVTEANAGDVNQAEQLVEWSSNDGTFYRKWATPIINNLKKQAVSGKYDKGKAIKAWERAASAAADLYAKEYGEAGAKGKLMFSNSVRKLAAKMYAEDYEEEIFYGVNQ